MTDQSPLPPDHAILALVPLLTGVARRMTGQREAADDLVQETVMNLCQRLRGGPPVEQLRPYALTMLRNLHRKTRGSTPAFEDLTENCASTPPDALARLACAEIDRAIAALPPDQARMLLLVRAGHESPADIARITGLPSGTVMSRLARARRKLRDGMQMAEGESAASLCD